MSNVARESQVSRKTVEGYIEVLEDLLLVFRLPVFNRRAARATSAHPKFFLFDAGVFRSLRPRGPLDRPAEIDGAALEGLVAQHLRAWAAYSQGEHELGFWRTRSGLEVDFTVYGDSGFWAIEVKNALRIRPEDVRPLRLFVEDYPEATPLPVSRIGSAAGRRHSGPAGGRFSARAGAGYGSGGWVVGCVAHELSPATANLREFSRVAGLRAQDWSPTAP